MISCIPLQCTGLLSHQRPQKNKKRSKKFLKAKPKGLWCLRSPVVCKKSYIWVVFHCKEFPKVIGHFKSLCFSGNKFLTIHGDPRYIPKIWVTPTAFVSRLSWKLLKKTVSKFRHQLALTVFLLQSLGKTDFWLSHLAFNENKFLTIHS